MSRREEIQKFVKSFESAIDSIVENSSLSECIDDALLSKQSIWVDRVNNLYVKQDVAVGIAKARLEDHMETRIARNDYQMAQDAHSKPEVIRQFLDAFTEALATAELCSKNRPVLKKFLEDEVDRGTIISEKQAYTLARNKDIIAMMDEPQDKLFRQVIRQALENIEKGSGYSR